MGTGAIGYLQQPPSQQPGFPQQERAVVAAWAESDSKRAAANANTNTLSFMTISFELADETRARESVSMRCFWTHSQELV